MSLKITGSYVSWQWQMIQNLERNWLVSSKSTWGIWQILTWALENLKNLHFNGLLLNKVHNIWAKKKYREVLLDDTEYWCNISRKTDLCFQKLHGEFSKFSSERLKMSKSVFSRDPFAQSRKYMRLKFTEEL